MTDVIRNLDLIETLIEQSVARGKAYRARLDRAIARDDTKEIFVCNTMRNREIKVYRKLLADKAQLESLPVDCRLGYSHYDGRGYVAL